MSKHLLTNTFYDLQGHSHILWVLYVQYIQYGKHHRHCLFETGHLDGNHPIGGHQKPASSQYLFCNRINIFIMIIVIITTSSYFKWDTAGLCPAWSQQSGHYAAQSPVSLYTVIGIHGGFATLNWLKLQINCDYNITHLKMD